VSGRRRLRGLLRHPPRVDLGPLTPFQRAVVRFNASDAGHSVAVLSRTLGTPRASVGSAAGAPGEMRVTVAWELSWYQWGVDPDDDLCPVFELDKGGEIDQLDAAARQWNAVVAADGRLRLAGEPAPSR
jgi:hypothetical protein